MNHVQDAVKAALAKQPFHREMTPQQLSDALDSFWGQVAMTVKSGLKDAQLQSIYAVLFAQVRAENNRIAWQDEPEVFTRVAQRDWRRDVAALLPGLAALIMLCMAIVKGQQKDLWSAILCGIAVALVIAGLGLQAMKSGVASHRVEQRLRPASIARSLEETARMLDGNAENLLGLLHPVSQEGGLEALELVQELYRAPEAMDENVAAALQMYLRQRGVKEITYSAESAALFDVMPANGTKTIQPALVQETAAGRTLVCKGLACVKPEA